MTKLTIGADPELFLYDKKKGRCIPAVGFVPGTKEEPFRLTHGTVQLDGTLIEIGPDPATTPEEFVHNIKSVIRDTQAILDKVEKGRYELHCGSIYRYHPNDLVGVPEEAFEVGCEPDFKVHSNPVGGVKLVKVERPDNPDKKVTAGGHLHFGFTEGAELSDPLFLRDCYYILGYMASRVYFNMTDAEYGREVDRQIIGGFYGSSGKSPVRIKSYGVEWRRLSSFWLTSESLILDIAKVFFAVGSGESLFAELNDRDVRSRRVGKTFKVLEV